MPYRDTYSDMEDDDEDAGADPDVEDREAPEVADVDDGDDPETVPCPYCRRPIWEEAELCPHCKNYLSREDAPRRYPWWLIAGVAACLAIVLLWVLTRGTQR